MADKGALILSDLHFSYPDGRKAVDGVSAAFPAGSRTGIVGANGAGKSTLLQILPGLLLPAAGEVLLDGLALGPATRARFRRRIGLAFQHPEDQLFMASVGEDVAFGPRNLGLGESEVAARVAEALDRVGLADCRDRHPLSLSGGEKRAAALAGILAMRPEIVILDEPTASLDPVARRRVMGFVAGMSGTVIVATHDLDMVLETCEHVLVMRDGAVRARGLAKALLTDARLLRDCGLEPPLALQGCPRCGAGRQCVDSEYP